MSDPFLRRKSRPSLFLTEDQPLLVLLRNLFIESEAPFCVKELAAELDVEVFTVYKMFSAQTRLPADVLMSIVHFIGTRDHRLVDLICGEAGYTPMPNDVLENRKALRELLEHAERLIKREG
jgi:hypothetical protein